MRWDVETSIDSEGGYLMAKLDDFRAARAGHGERDTERVPGQGAMAAHTGGARGFPQGDEAPNDIAEFYKWLKA